MQNPMKGGYANLAMQTAISGVIMYLVMFVMIDRLSNFHHNLNTLYMTLMMVSPMLVLMILGMRHMFPSRKANWTILAGSVAVFFGAFGLIRTQTTIGDDAFLRSMIPHHAGAVLMCSEAKLTDPEIVDLCRNIIRSQRQEIEQMEAILARRD